MSSTEEPETYDVEEDEDPGTYDGGESETASDDD